MITEHERVVLLRELPTGGVAAGAIGTVVYCYAAGLGYEVEFMANDGHTIAVATVSAEQIRRVIEPKLSL